MELGSNVRDPMLYIYAFLATLKKHPSIHLSSRIVWEISRELGLFCLSRDCIEELTSSLSSTFFFFSAWFMGFPEFIIYWVQWVFPS